MLTIANITKKYKNDTALNKISLELSEGIYGLLSPNGAGKTTLLKIIATLLSPTSGYVCYNGNDIWQMGEDYRKLLGYMPQHFGYYREYSILRYLRYIAALKGFGKKEADPVINDLLCQFGLFEIRKQKMKICSGGIVQRVGIAQALLNNPKILILDEPTAGLDPMEREQFRELLSAISQDKIVLYSTHIVSDVEPIADRIIMLKDHRLCCDATVEELCNSPENNGERITLEQVFFKTYKEQEMVL